MKTTKIILSIACTFLLNVTAYAQFNTIGTYDHKRIKTENPSKPVETPTDSILVTDSISSFDKTDMLGNKTYRLTGEQRTGCMFCMFGCHLEPHPNRFERLRFTHPKQYRYCMEKLGLDEVLNYIDVDH